MKHPNSRMEYMFISFKEITFWLVIPKGFVEKWKNIQYLRDFEKIPGVNAVNK